MSFTRTFKRKKKDGTVRTYYAEVESVRVGDKVFQRYIRPLGSDPEHPKNILIEPVRFSYLALRLMQGALTPNDLFEMLGKIGQPVKKEALEKIGINYDFNKKNRLNLPLLQEDLKIKNPDRCPICKEYPVRQTTYKRKITTLSGEHIISFRKKYCRYHGLINKETISTIQKICPIKRNFDTKVIIAIGLLRWSFNCQREEIQLLLEGQGIRISTGEISILSEEFLLRFYVLHNKHRSRMKKTFKKNGGYILNLHRSAGSGDEITLTAKEEMTGFTIDSCIMPSESREYIIPFLRSIRQKYGKPLTVVRDISEEIADSVSKVFPRVSQQVCHYHFVRKLGVIIFKHRYEELRKIILKTKIIARIVALKKTCMDGISSYEKTLIAENWIKLAIEYMLYPIERKSDYPFVLPYLEVINRIIEVQKILKKIVMGNAKHNIGVKVVLKFEKYLKKLTEKMEIKVCCNKIKHIQSWFEEIRKELQVSREFSDKEQNFIPTKVNEMKQKFYDTIIKIRDQGHKLGGEYVEISKKIFQNCHDHKDELFVKVKDMNGEEIRIISHNGIEELNHRRSRMHIRRRTGRNRTTIQMEKYAALLAVFSNIENVEYIKMVLAEVKDFVKDMQDVTGKDLLDARKLIRTFPKSPLIRSNA
ncbi:Uncharacterised protein [uncultured archaeon]|nr:Uncharacterised protein [uncultured archaeon]